MLYLSLYLKTHRTAYYQHLQNVRLNGDWESWLAFFLQDVARTANNAYTSALRIITLFRTDREEITSTSDQTGSMLRIHEVLQAHPFLNAGQARERTGLSTPTVNKTFETLESLGIIREITGKQRGRVFAYQKFLDILDEGTHV